MCHGPRLLAVVLSTLVQMSLFSGRQWSPGSDFTAEVLRLPTRSTPFTVSWQLAERIAL